MWLPGVRIGISNTKKFSDSRTILYPDCGGDGTDLYVK